jgi:D-alanyl-D-alanine carboxypeptidase/D-alanyl-D-alanine-endopeptidase (penicillin-binding protein 4)
MNIIRFCFLLFLFPYFSKAQTSTEKIINTFIQHDAIKNAHVGFVFVDMNDGKVLLEHNCNKAFIPASTQKLVTTAAAYLQLEKDFKYETKVYFLGKQISDLFDGYVLVVGSGDPGFASDIEGYDNLTKVKDDIMNTLKSRGIKKLKHGFEINPFVLPYYDQLHDNISGGTIWEDIGNYYASGIYGLNFNQNKFDLIFRQKPNEGEELLLESEYPVLQIPKTISVKSGKKGSGDMTYVSPERFDGSLVVKGTLAPGNGTYTVKGSIPNPPLQFANYLRNFANENDIICTRAIAANDIRPTSTKPDLVYQSPSLTNLITQANMKSNNIFAEALFRSFSISYNGKGDLKSANEAIYNFWETKGIKAQSCHFADGSGLSRTNLLTPQFQAAMLRYTLLQDASNLFENTLAVAGKSGTLTNFCKDTPLANNLKGKSGNMSKVTAYTGIFTNKKGEKICFSIMVNNFDVSGSQVKSAIEKLLEAVNEN